jgi:hypothetical protein
LVEITLIMNTYNTCNKALLVLFKSILFLQTRTFDNKHFYSCEKMLVCVKIVLAVLIGTDTI